MRTLIRRDEGQASFEFLLMLPFFIFFLLLAIDFGIMMYQYVSVSNAVREGARYAAVNCGDGSCTAADVAQRVVDRSGGMLSNPGDVTVNWVDTNGDGKASRGEPVVVKVSVPYNFLFVAGASIDVVSCADMRLEQTDKTTGLPTGADC